MTNISDTIKAALAEYYMHRRLAAHGHAWEKARDLAQVAAVAESEGWSVEAVAGTFWFTRPSVFGEIHVRADETNYLMGGRPNIGGVVEPLGAFTELAQVLRKASRIEGAGDDEF